MIKTWYEIWADDGLEVPYLLLVLPEHGSEAIAVLDPKEGGRIVHRANDYEAARLWLLEDEYHLVEGRMLRD
jgi:hypothetical protein